MEQRKEDTETESSIQKASTVKSESTPEHIQSKKVAIDLKNADLAPGGLNKIYDDEEESYYDEEAESVYYSQSHSRSQSSNEQNRQQQ